MPRHARPSLGGAYQASSKYAMLPRANTVTLLVLVPKDKNGDKRVRSPRVLPVSLRTRLRNAVSGELVSDIDRADRHLNLERFAATADEYGLLQHGDRWKSDCDCGPPPKDAEDFLLRLDDEVYASNYPKFLVLYRCNEDLSKYHIEPAELWLDLSDLQAGYGYSRTHVELPRDLPPRLPEPQLALLSDDTSSGATVRLAGGEGLIADEVRAALVLPRHSTGRPRQLDAQNQSEERRLPAQSVSHSGNDLVLSFPSPAAWKLVADEGGKTAIPGGTKINVSLPGHTKTSDGVCSEEKRLGATRTESCFRNYDVAYVAKAKTPPDPGFSTSATVRTVAIGEKGTGSYSFALNLGEAKRVLLRGDGVVVSKVDPAQFVPKDYAWQLTSSGLVTVTFDQLTPGQQFKLILTGTEKATHELPIEAKKLAADEKKADAAK